MNASERIDLPSHTDRFFENMIEMSNFVYDLVSRVKNLGYAVVAPELVQLGTTILQSYNRRELLEGFIDHSFDHWDEIYNKNEDFMHDNAFAIFSNLPSHHVEAFKAILLLKDKNGELVVDQIDRDTLWSFFHSYVKIAIKFIHEERKPYCRNGEFRYANKYLPTVQLDQHAKKWNVKLPFPQKD